MITDSKTAKRLSALGKLSGRQGKRGKSKLTLIREQILKEHASKTLGVLTEMTDIQIDLARFPINKKKPNSRIMDVKLRASESIVDRVLGKAKSNMDVTVTIPHPILNGGSRETLQIPTDNSTKESS